MFTSIPLMPHAVCWKADPRLIWTMVVANGLTFLSYSSICVTLLVLLRGTRRVIARDWSWFVIGFALFIVACGSTHLMEVVTTWVPFFWVDAGSNVVTALLSAYVAIMLIRRVNAIGFSINDYAGRLSNTEQEKVQMADSLMAAQKLRDWSRMSGVVAHEIANPLEAIQNLLYLIKQSDEVSPRVVQLADAAAEEADRVITISRSTLSFFRQGSHFEPIDLRGAADSVRVLMEHSFRKKDLELRIESGGDVVVEAMPGEPRQVLLNLVRNAYEATNRRGADVCILLNGRPAGVEIVVQDQGSGIDDAVLSDLFQFGLTTKGEQGNGMGLWSVKQIVARHGGEIHVDTKAGQGTRFTLWWPRKAPAARTAADTSVAGAL